MPGIESDNSTRLYDESNPTVFDVRLADHPTTTVAASSLVDPLHRTDAPEKVSAYRDAMRRGDRFPPVSVVSLFGRLWVADGHKRLSAARALGVREVPIQIWTHAQWLADQRRQARASLARWSDILASPDWSTRGGRAAAEVAATVSHWSRIARSMCTLGAQSRVGAPRRTLRRLLSDCLRASKAAPLGLALLLALGAMQLVATWVIAGWVDRALEAGADFAVAPVALVGFSAAVLLAVTVFVAHYALALAEQRTALRLREAVNQAVLAGRVDGPLRPRGDLITRIVEDVEVASGVVDGVLRRMVGDSAVLIGAVAMMAILDWRLAVGAAAILVAFATAMDRVGRAIRRGAMRAQEGLSSLASLFGEQIAGLTTVKGFLAEAHEEARFRAEARRRLRGRMRVEAWSAAFLALLWLGVVSAIVVLLLYGGPQVASGDLSRGTLLAFCLYAVQTVEPLRRLGQLQSQLQKVLAAADRVYEIVDQPREDPGVQRKRSSDRARGRIRFDRVDFSYAADAPVLRACTAEIAAREMVALVAPTGHGKSTIGRLLRRYEEVEAGAIEIDGRDLRHWSLPELRSTVCVVEQEAFLFAGSLRENLLYGNPDASRSEVDRVVSLIDMDDIAGNPIEEGGRNLSGGQRQRVAIARAVLRDPPILVLDEATAALDGESEERLFTRLGDWLARRTVLVMAHRPSTIQRADRAIVLLDGTVRQVGAPRQLAAESGVFREVLGSP